MNEDTGIRIEDALPEAVARCNVICCKVVDSEKDATYPTTSTFGNDLYKSSASDGDIAGGTKANRMQCPRGHWLDMQKSASRKAGVAGRHHCCHLCGCHMPEDRRMLHCDQCVFSVCHSCKTQLACWAQSREQLQQRSLLRTMSSMEPSRDFRSAPSMLRESLPRTPRCLRPVHLQQASHFAVACSDEESLDKLIALRPTLPLKCRLADGSTLLHTAARMSARPTVETLLHTGMDAEAADVFGMTPLHWAAAVGSEDIVEAFLLHGVNVMATDQFGWLPMHHAAEHGFGPVVSTLLEARCTPLYGNNDYLTPLHLAAKAGHLEVVQLLLEACPQAAHVGRMCRDTEIEDDQYTALHAAAAGGQVEVSQLLLSRGADVDVRCARGQTPLHVAAESNHGPITAAFIHAGADPNVPDHQTGNTPLHIAATNGSLQVARALIMSKKVDVDRRNAQGCSALHVAVLNDRVPLITCYLGAGADPDAPVDEIAASSFMKDCSPMSSADSPSRVMSGAAASTWQVMSPERAATGSSELRLSSAPIARSTPLHLARSRAAALALIKAGANVNLLCERGYTALMAAAAAGLAAVTRVIIDAHAALDIADDQGMTAAHLASSACSADILKQLSLAGADINMLDKNGSTALDIASKLHSRALLLDLLKARALPDRSLLKCNEPGDILATHSHLGALGGCKACYIKLRGWPDESFGTQCWCGGELYRAKKKLDDIRKVLFLGAPVVISDSLPALRWGALDKDVLESILLRSGITLPRGKYPTDMVDSRSSSCTGLSSASG